LSRAILWLAVIYNVGQLVYFKFFSQSLPIGISFYTFQALSYVIDVYRKSVEASRDPIAFGAYVTLYPQLIAGPIVRYSDVDNELRTRKHTVEATASGIRTFCIGLAKKVLLADVAGEAWEFFAHRGGFVDAYAGIFFFAMQIYFDFSGYSDMACGLGRIFGFSFPKNFNYPYISKSISEFWRRWHITLSSFFKEYVYISLGGNRVGAVKTYRNLLITWALTGLWHGATLNFLVWGLYFAIILIIEKAFLLRFLKKLPDFFQHFYAIFFIALGWVIFATDGQSLSLAEGGKYVARLFGFFTSGFCSYLTLYELSRYLVIIVILIFGATPLPKQIYTRLRERFPTLISVLNFILLTAAFVLSVAYIVNSGYHPFLYLRF
jgi:alginate O-acetyltransferase complex protein AlgI